MKPRTLRHLRQFHRGIAYIVAFGLLFLSLSGVLLNHSDSLHLNKTHINQAWLLSWYDMDNSKNDQAYLGFDENNRPFWLSQQQDRLFWNHQKIALQGELKGMAQQGSIVYIVLSNKVAFLTQNGEVIDTIKLPKDTPSHFTFNWIKSFNSAAIGLNINHQPWVFNDDLTAMVPKSKKEVQPLTASHLSSIPDSTLAKIPKPQAGELTWEKVILELHNGYFFGQVGPYLLDLFALLIVLMVATGLVLKTKQ